MSSEQKIEEFHRETKTNTANDDTSETIESPKTNENQKYTITPPNRQIKNKHNTSAHCKFTLNDRIGKGSFATVYRGKWDGGITENKTESYKENKKEVAIKVVQRSHLKREKRLMDIFESEMAILKRMKHPHIVHLFDVVKTSSDFNLIMEYCSIGDLSSFIRKKHQLAKLHPEIGDVFTRYPSERPGLHPTLVRHFLAQLACSLAFLRQHDIVHRDVKPQNLLLKPGASSPEEAKALGYAGSWDLPVIKVADFGFARFLPSTSMAETLCGSPLYMAPEILNYEKYNAKADLWSVGAVTYEMVTGKQPFPAANHLELIKKIDESKDVINFPHDVATDLQDVIRKLLKRMPAERLSFEEFFARTAWSKTDADIALRVSEATLIKSNSVSPLSSVVSNNLENIPDKPSYSSYLRRRGEGDVAIESASPSPESSQVSGTNKNETDPEVDDGIDKLSPRRRGENSENEYVIIEKRTVEVNSLADDLQAPVLPVRRLTNPEKKPRRRRLSSITYGASPTSALAQALLKSSARLFGAKVDNSNMSTGSSVTDSDSFQTPLNTAITPSKTGEKQIIDELEQLATIAKVVILYADVKSSQLEYTDNKDVVEAIDIPDQDRAALSSRTTTRRVSNMDDSSTIDHCLDSLPGAHIDPFFQLTLAQETVALHLKALSILARAMDRASEWWDGNRSKYGAPEDTPTINTLVQWIRDKFNECIDRAETERAIISRLSAEFSDDISHTSEVSAERLLFERSLEMAKAAAVQEMTALSGSNETSSEAITTCEMNYGTAVWMLKALTICDQPGDDLGEDDKVMVDTLMAKIAQRLATLRRKLSLAQSASNMRAKYSFGSPATQNSQRQLKMGSNSPPFSQLTPP